MADSPASTLNELEAPSAERRGRQIALFYSYKGGVGRTMAMCNVAAYLAEALHKYPPSSRPILCVDLDLEAPSVSMYLRSDAVVPRECGLAQLLNDFLDRFPGKDPGPPAVEWLTRALAPGSQYLYRVRRDRDLYVLPTGLGPYTPGVTPQDWLQQFGRLPEALPRLSQWKEEIRHIFKGHYAYTLMDCRAGLPSIEFALANHFADVMVPFFRANSTHLAGVQYALAMFVRDRGRKVTDQDVPVIPILSPRPAYTDQRIRQMRSLAREKIFRWLDPARNPAHKEPLRLSRYTEFIELAFDKTVELGEPLLIPLGATDGAMESRESVQGYDDEAPLFVGYQRLAQALQKGNCLYDPIGAGLRENEAIEKGEPALALEYRLCTLELEPKVLEHWRGLWTLYGDYLKRDDTARHRVRELCENHLDTDAPVAVAKASLWLADFIYNEDLRLRLRFLEEAWTVSMQADSPDLLHDVLLHLNRLLRSHPSAELTNTLPSAATALAVRTIEVFSRPPTLHSAFEQLCTLEQHFSLKPEHADEIERTLQDQLSLAEQSALRAVIYTELGNHYRQQLELDAFTVALNHALAEPGCGIEQAEIALDRLSRVIPYEEWCEKGERWASALSPGLQANRLPPVERRAFLANRALLAEWGPQARIAQVLDALRCGEYKYVIELCRADHWRDARERLPLRSLALWLQGGTQAISEALVEDAISIWEHSKTGPVVTYYLLAAWAGSPQTVAKHAIQRLSEARRWPMDHFWYLFFAASGTGAKKLRAELHATVERNPLLAQWVSRSGLFFLFRRIWRRHYEESRLSGTPDCDIVAFEKELDTIEQIARQKVLPISRKRPFPLFSKDNLREIATYWKAWAQKEAYKSGIEILRKLDIPVLPK